MFVNKVVIVTGGNAGIGAAIAEGFAKEGASLAIVGRNEAKLNNVAQHCKNLGANILIIKADVSVDREAEDIVKKTIDRYGKLDVLVNNAGVLKTVTLSESNMLQAYDEIMTTNLRSAVHITSLAIPYLQETKGNIINMSSAAANTELPGISAYCISKAGVDKFTKCAALEFASSGVRVNSVNPGPVESDMLKTLLTLDCLTDKSVSDMTALGRASEAKEVADLVLYLASDKARSITGSCYAIDNGILLK